MTITKKKKEIYLRGEGYHCPFCKSENIDSDPIRFDYEISAKVRCLDCKKIWYDVYKLVDVYEMEK